MKTQFRYEEPEVKQLTLMTLVHADTSCLIGDVVTDDDACADGDSTTEEGSL